MKITVAALLVIFFVGGCKDENVEIIRVCPEVVSTSPFSQEVGVGLGTTISVTFNEDMDPTTLALELFQSVGQSGGRTGSSQQSELLVGSLTYDATTFTMHFTPTENIKANTIYTAIVGTSAKDLFGMALQKPYEWTFNTSTVPTVISTDPTDHTTDVSVDKVISATFSEPMDPITINNESFTLRVGNILVPGVITYEGTTVYFTPTTHCTTCTSYVVTITTAAKSLGGIPLASNYVWSFTTTP